MRQLLLKAAWLTLLAHTVSAILTNVDAKSINGSHFDYVILGGGTAGLVVAARLSEDPAVTVAVIEAGDFENHNPNVTNTTVNGIAKADPSVNWNYYTAPQTYAGNQTIYYSAGKGMGGSSLINGMTYMRASDSQLNVWPSLGLELDWEIVFNYSKKGEDFTPPSARLEALGADYVPFDHGESGPLTTCISPHITASNIHNTFNNTWKAMGVSPRYEFDGGELLGFGIQMCTQNEQLDIRESSAQAYYYPNAGRSNLMAIVNTTATRILWTDDNSDCEAVASAAQIVAQNGDTSTIYADREIILSAGAIRSPAILEHSGVGNPSILSPLGIKTKINLPAVGENLQDQTTMAIAGPTLGLNTSGFLPFVAQVSLHDLFGADTSAVYKSTLAKLPHYAATIASQNGGSSSAATQEHLLRTQLDLLFSSNTPTSEIVPLALETEIGCVFWPLQPFSRGSVHINTTHELAQPNIEARFFQIDFDGQVAVATAKYSQQFLHTEPVASVVNLSAIVPPIPADASDEKWLHWVKQKSDFQPNYHDLGTCAMLPKESGGVVDNDFRVYGTANVRVVDLSVLPLQIAGHSTANLYGIAEWASEKIKGKV